MTQDPSGSTPTARSGRGVYGISVASELSGVGQQALRLYESKGLLTPARTEGGTRRYSDDDIARLRQITDLLAEGVNLAAVQRILMLEGRNADLQSGAGRLESANAQLTSDNARLRSDNNRLRGDNAQLVSDNDQLRQEREALMTTTDRTVDEIGEADLLDQRRDADAGDVDAGPDLDEIAPRVAAGWDCSEADRLDQELTVPLDDERLSAHRHSSQDSAEQW